MATQVFPQVGLVKKKKDDVSGLEEGAPAKKTSFRDRSTFEIKYPTYQWTKGFDVDLSEVNEVVTMRCTQPGCPFLIAVVPKQHFGNDADKTPFIAWSIAEGSFHPDHNHSSPYEPLSIDEENARRKLPLPLDYHPPLIRRSAFRDLLQTFDPTLLTDQLCAEAEAVGLIDITLEELLDLDSASLRAALDESVPSATAMAKLEIMEGWRIAGERRGRGEEPSGHLGRDKEEHAELVKWLESKF